MAHDETVFEPDAAWTRALEKYGAATHLAVELYGRDEHLILGPVHRTRLFELLAPGHHTLSMFAACVRRCLAQTAGASPIVVEQRHRFAVIGSSLALNGEVVGAAVAAYVLTAFPDEHAVRRLAKECNVPFSTLWQRIRAELPPHSRPVERVRRTAPGPLQRPPQRELSRQAARAGGDA